MSLAGFKHLALIEQNRDCCATMTRNKQRSIAHVAGWPLFEIDRCNYDYSEVPGDIDLLAAGPPCQPFSIGGNHKGLADPRNLFAEVARAARILQPKAILIENVRGLLRPAFSESLQYVLLDLSYPRSKN